MSLPDISIHVIIRNIICKIPAISFRDINLKSVNINIIASSVHLSLIMYPNPYQQFMWYMSMHR